jgi:ribosomal protein S18 acetylase RimI-like enzyme
MYIGSLEADIEGTCAHISNFIVKKEFRGKGLGKNILMAMISEIRSMNIKMISLDVEENNIIAYNLYTRLGFKPLSRFYRLRLEIRKDC